MPDGPIHLRFDASTHPDAAERIAAWRDAMSLSVDVAFRPEEIDGFEGQLDFYPLGTVLLVEARTTPHTVIRDEKSIARSGDAHVILDVFPAGGFSGIVGRQQLAIRPGDGFVMDLRGTMQVHLQASHFIGVIIPRKLLGSPAAGGTALHGLRFAADSLQAQLLGSVLTGFIAQAPRLTGPCAAPFGVALVGLIAACLDQGGTSRRKKPTSLPEPNLARVRRQIERHASDPALDPDQLSADFGLSRATLYRMFKAEGGVAELIRRRRTAIARHLLSDPHSPYGSIDAIARASGFSDTRSLRRALRDVYNLLPSQLRQAEQSLANGEHGIEIGAMFDTLE